MLLHLIKKWLWKRFDIHVSVVPAYFYEATRDGTLLAQVLRQCDVITSEELHKIEETCNPTVAYNNYVNHINGWLNRIDISLSDGDIYELTHCEGTAAGAIFYEMYLKLENKEGVVRPMKRLARHFKIDRVNEDHPNDLFLESNPLCEPLLRQWDIIHWERDHLASIMIRYVHSRDEYYQYLGQKRIQQLDTPKSVMHDNLHFDKAEKTDYTYDELLAQQQKALQMDSFEPNTDEARRIMKRIRSRNKEQAAKNAFRLELAQELMTEVWGKIEDSREEEFDKTVCEKLLKQSVHEKEIAEKLLAIRQHKETMIEKRKAQDAVDEKRRDEEFVRKLFEDSLQERLKFHEERMALIAEHRRLYEEKLRRKALKHEKACREVVEDIVDLALKTAEYKEMYGLEPDKYVQRDWATLFMKQQPVFDLVTPLEDIKQRPEDVTAEIEDIYRREVIRQDVLDEQEFNDYIHFRNNWTIDEVLDDFTTPMTLGMNCLGYIVHKLLLKKYPLPIPQKPHLPQEIEISVCANNMNDLSRLDFLQKLLDLKGVKVMQIGDATNFCIQAYESELKTEYDDPFPEDVIKELAPTQMTEAKKDGKKGKKDKKDKGGKKGKQSDKSKKGSKKDGKKGKKAASEIEVVVRHFQDTQSQTPRLFPCERITFSNKAKLGRIAKQILAQDAPLPDKLLVDMFVEYLQSLKDLKGWVLINYPNTYEQASLLEQALSGKPVPSEYYHKNLNKESLTSVQVEDENRITTTPPQIQQLSIEELPEAESTESVKETLTLGQGRSRTGSMKDRTRRNSDVSELSEISLRDQWSICAKDRVKALLPDLVRLAFSSDENEDGEQETGEQYRGTCICACNSPRHIKHEEETRECTPVQSSVVFADEAEMLKKATDYESVNTDTPPLDFNEECVCYLNQVPQEFNVVEVEERKTQTDIMGLEGYIDDELVERGKIDDLFELKRLSRIVPNPRPLDKEEYSTVLTAYIRIVEKEEKNDDDEYPLPLYEEFIKKDGLEKFYCDQGCFYILQYDEFTSDTIKCLAKMIIGDYSLPWKTSVEIFGERYKEAVLEDGDHKITKQGKTKEKKKEKKKKDKKSATKTTKSDKSIKTKSGKNDKKKKGEKGKKGKKDKKGKKGEKDEPETEAVGHEDKEVQVPFEEEVEEEELREPRAGEADWDYVNLPIPPELEQAIATLWDNFESNYRNSFKDVFFGKRVIFNNIVPFLAKTKANMDSFIARPDQKQFYLRQFQKTLNQIDLQCRDDPQTKSALFCMIDEFKEKLLGICDTKMRESEEERRNFVRQNWLYGQFCEIANNSSIAYQLEIDRLVDTLQFLSDYYTAVITKSTSDGYDFHKELLQKHECHEGSDKFNNLFIDINVEEATTEFHTYIEANKQLALTFLDSLTQLAFKPLNDMKKIFEPKDKKKGLRKFEPDEDVKDNAARIFEEWECAINGEVARMHLHLKVVRNEALRRIEDVIAWTKKIFQEIYDAVSVKYENELASVHKACELLTQSVQQGVIIQPELTFEGDQLAQIQVELFAGLLSRPEDDYKDASFKIEQIELMVRVLLDLAPAGFIMKKTFLLLIQDILYQDEDEEIRNVWRELSTSALSELLKRLFDDEKYLYWKDFIICNLGVPFPSREQLMKVRKQFRNHDFASSELITRREYDAVELWFEDDDHERVRNVLFKMYQTNDRDLNYTALLLDFCKDEDPVCGFVKALELSLGKFICYDKHAGDEFVKEVLDGRMRFEQEQNEHDENLVLAKRAVSLLVENILGEIDGTEGFTLAEISEQVVTSGGESSLKSRSASVRSVGHEGGIITEHKFSYTQIGYEARDDTQMAYFLPLDLVMAIVGTEVTWNLEISSLEAESFADKIVRIYEECANEEFNNAVLSHEFLNCDKLKELIGTAAKFSAKNPVKLAKRILCDPPESLADPEEFVQKKRSEGSEWMGY